MERDPQERLTRVFKHLQAGLQQFVKRELEASHGGNWEPLALGAFPPSHHIHQEFGRPHSSVWDSKALLEVIDYRWRNDFEIKLGRDARNWVKELRNVRNKWAHQSKMDNDLVWRAIDSAERLLRAAGSSDYATLVGKEKTGLLEGRPSVNEEPRTVKVTHSLPSSKPSKPPETKKPPSQSDRVFQLCLGATYYRTGFFNVSVKYDSLVRSSDGEITIQIEPSGESFPAKVNRTANTNGTARIMGGTPLRDWFHRSCTEQQTLYIDFPSKTTLRISKSPFASPQ